MKNRISVFMLVMTVGLAGKIFGDSQKICGAPVEQQRAQILWTKPICKQPGRYIGWPTICLKKDGELLAVFSGDRDEHACPFGKVHMIRSSDLGETWSTPGVICNTPLDDRDAGIVELPNGDLLVTWFTSLAYKVFIQDRSKLEPGSHRFYWWLHHDKLPKAVKEEWLGYFTALSTDSGKTWSEPVRTPGTTPHGPIVLADGRLLYVGRTCCGKTAVYSGERNEIVVAESRDNANSWQRITSIPLLEGEDAEQFHEPHVVETDDGRLVVQARFHAKPAPGKRFRDDTLSILRQAESSDGGRTWTRMQPTKIQGYPPHLIKLRSGKLITAYGRRLASGYGEYVCISDDHGRTWDVANEIKLAGHFNHDLGYPASAELPDGSILTIYYQAEKKDEKTCLMATKWRIK